MQKQFDDIELLKNLINSLYERELLTFEEYQKALSKMYEYGHNSN